MNTRISHILLGFMSIVAMISYAQQNIYSFKHLTIDNGLSQNSINCIFQDSKGFMWFGTQDGLNRFDGYNFKHFRAEKDNPNSITNNYIWDIYEDDDGMLWIATFGGGLNGINLMTGEIETYLPNVNDPSSFPSSRIFSITEFPKGILWIGSNEGLVKFDTRSKESEIFLSEKTSDNRLKDNYVGVVSSDGKGYIWLRTDSGLTRFDTKSNTATNYKYSPFSNAIELGDIFDIKQIKGTTVVACEAGLVGIDFETGTDDLIVDAYLGHQSEAPFIFKTIQSIDDKRFTIGTNQGLIIYDFKDNTHVIYDSDATDSRSLSHNNVLDVYQSTDAVIWIGTRNGLNKIEDQEPDFIHIRHIPGKNRLSSKNVNSFIEENDSLIWVGTTDGLNLYDKKNDAFTVFRKSVNLDALKTNYILCLFKDSKGNKWIGTRQNGFYKIRKSSGGKVSFEHIKPINKDFSAISVHYIAEAKDGNLWLGTGGSGLCKYNPSTNTVKVFPAAKDGSGPSHPYIFTILEDSFDNLWLGTPTGGLNLFETESERFLYFQNNPELTNSLSNDIILSLHEDEKHTLWIGTNGGLNKLIPTLEPNMFDKLSKDNDSLFVSFGEEQGFPNDVVYGMLPDEYQNLWISTNNGLVTFNTNQEEVVNKFDVSHGLQNNEFNQNGYYKSSTGQFYFGGVNGFNMFFPYNIQGNTYIPPLVLTDLLLYNQPVKIGKKSKATQFTLNKELQYLDEIELSWKHDVVSFNYTTLNYNSPEKNTYSYKLEGFNQDWVFADNQRTTTYTNLDPGDYIFKVRASNSSGLWNNEGVQLRVHITTPPWLSWYAYIFYFLLISMTAYVFLKVRIQRATEKIKMQAQIEKARVASREEFRKRSSRDFHDESGTRITRLALITELAKLKAKEDEDLMDYLNQIESNLQDLNNGMRDFIWALDPSKDNMFDTLSRFTEFAGKFCEYGEIQFKSDEVPERLKDVELNMSERRHLLLILKEALNNCIKHGKPTNVTFNVELKLPKIILSLNDNGKGFDTDKVSSGNGLKNIKERAEAINANLRIVSQPHHGTSVQLIIQTTQMGN